MENTVKRSDNTAAHIAKLNAAFMSILSFTDCSYGNDESDSCESEFKGIRLQVFLPNPTQKSFNNFIVKIDEDDSYYLSNDKSEDAFNTIEETIQIINSYILSH